MAIKRIVPGQVCGVIIDVQDFFLQQLDKPARSALKSNLKHFLRLLGYFQAPLVATLERPVDRKGTLPKDLRKVLGDSGQAFEKDFFDLTKEKPIREHLTRLKRKQMVVAGCETDVCVLQSCLGLLGMGFEVFLIDELLFSSARDVSAARARLAAAGCTFVTYKTLFYEMIEAVDGGAHGAKMLAKFGEFPDVPDVAEA